MILSFWHPVPSLFIASLFWQYKCSLKDATGPLLMLLTLHIYCLVKETDLEIWNPPHTWSNIEKNLSLRLFRSTLSERQKNFTSKIPERKRAIIFTWIWDIYDEEVKKSARSEERRTKTNLIFHFRLFWASILDMPSPDSVSPRSLHFFRWPTRSVQLSPPLTPILASRNESLVPVQVRRPLFGRHDDVCIILVSFVFV